MSVRPILFNTEMVRAILDGRKTQTRRLVREPFYIDDEDMARKAGLAIHRGTNITHGMPYHDRPYEPGDNLYVRETWCNVNSNIYPAYFYRADNDRPKDFDLTPWHPSIHMPKEAARIWLRVTDVRVERLRDINGHGILSEGIDNGRCNQSRINQLRWETNQRMAFEELWDSTIKPADLDRYGWAANPWVWVIAFERCEKPEE